MGELHSEQQSNGDALHPIQSVHNRRVFPLMNALQIEFLAPYFIL